MEKQSQGVKRKGSPTAGGALDNVAKKQKTEEPAPTTAASKEATVAKQHTPDAGAIQESSGIAADTEGVEGVENRSEGERIPDAATSGASNVTLDYDQWQPARIDPGTNDWDVKPADRKRIKFLRAIFDIDINHNDEQSGYTDNPKITFASSRLFGFQSPTLNRPSTAQVFPTVETININLECDDKPTDLPVERISHSHVVLVLKRQVIERVLGGELKWDGEVDAGVMVTWLGSTATGEKKDASSNEHHQMTHLPVMNPGVHYHIAVQLKESNGWLPLNSPDVATA